MFNKFWQILDNLQLWQTAIAVKRNYNITQRANYRHFDFRPILDIGVEEKCFHYKKNNVLRQTLTDRMPLLQWETFTLLFLFHLLQ